MSRKRIVIIIILAALGLLGAAAYKVAVLAMPGSANLESVRKTATPRLTAELASKNLKFGAPVFIRIFKREKILEVWLQAGPRFSPFKTYDICAYSGGLGPKLKQGDNQAPEGFYRVAASQLNPASRFHLSFNLGYPNAYDRAHGRTGNYSICLKFFRNGTSGLVSVSSSNEPI